MDRGAWWVTFHGVTKSRTRLSDCHFHVTEEVDSNLSDPAVQLPPGLHCRHCPEPGVALGAGWAIPLAALSEVGEPPRVGFGWPGLCVSSHAGRECGQSPWNQALCYCFVGLSGPAHRVDPDSLHGLVCLH